MIKVHYDVQTGKILGFYPDFISYQSIPEPTIEIDDETHRMCIEGNVKIDLVTMRIVDHEQVPTSDEIKAEHNASFLSQITFLETMLIRPMRELLSTETSTADKSLAQSKVDDIERQIQALRAQLLK